MINLRACFQAPLQYPFTARLVKVNWLAGAKWSRDGAREGWLSDRDTVDPLFIFRTGECRAHDWVDN